MSHCRHEGEKTMEVGKREHQCEMSHEQCELRPLGDFKVGIKDWQI